MSVQRWNADRHLPLIREWHAGPSRTSGALDPGLYPPTGFVADGCALGFLYTGEGTAVAFLANVLTDPRAPLAKRRTALERLADALIAEAESLRITTIRLATNDPEFRVIAASRGTNDVRVDPTTVYGAFPTHNLGSAEPLNS